MGDELIPVFMKIGLTEQKAKETAKNKNLSKTLSDVVETASKETGDLVQSGKILKELFLVAKLLYNYLCPSVCPSDLGGNVIFSAPN